MAVPGTKPKANALNRNKPTHEWVDVVEVPFDGTVPVGLPEERIVTTPKGAESVPVLAATRSWWDAICRMPHCILWGAPDWQFALATALVADLAFRGVSAAASELRQREKLMGTTWDFRRDLRVRYVKEATPVVDEPVVASGVASLDERRARINAS